MQRVAKVHWSVPLVVLLVLVVAGLWWWKSRAIVSPQALLKTAVAAVAAAENGNYDRALTLWDELLKARPGDADLLLNQAVTVLKWIDERSGKLSSGLVSDPTEQSKLRDELTAALEKAETTIAAVAKLPGSDERTAFLQATYFEAKSRQTPAPDDMKLRDQAVKVLIDALAVKPAQPLLACKLDVLAQEVSIENPTLTKHCADALYASWKLDPRNLYLVGRAGETLLLNEDPRLKELLLPSLTLAKPMLSMMKSTIDRMKPEEMLTKASAAIDTGDWRQVQPARQWFNILKGTSGFRSDARLVKPDIMALLDTRFLHRFSEALPASVVNAPTAVAYTTRTVSDKANVACWYDFDLDLDFDVATVAGKRLQLLKTDGDGIAREVQQELELPFEPIGIFPADLHDVDDSNRPRVPTTVAEKVQGTPETPLAPASSDPPATFKSKRHDTYQELVAWGEAGVAIVSLKAPVEIKENSDSNAPSLVLLQDTPGMSELTNVLQIEPCDVDGDGDLDLIVSCKTKMLILQNNGNRTFTDISEFSSLPEADFEATRMFACDIDRDLDQDVMLVNGSSGVFMLENILHSQFRFRKLEGKEWDAVGECDDVFVSDFDGNSSWDIATIGKSSDCVLTRTPAAGQWVVKANQQTTRSGNCLQTADLNNDSSIDLISGGATGLHVAWGTGDGQFADAEQPLAPGNAAMLSAIDADGDGMLEVLSIIDGQLALLKASQPLENKQLAVRLRGINDNNGGGRINHFAIGSTLELWSDTRMQARVIRHPVTHFGLGNQEPNNLRITFNNGLTQNATDIKANMLVEEKQELKGSCPFVYGWDGKQFQLITDLLWNAPLGLQYSRGEVLPDRRWEYLMLPGELMQPKDGQYELRFTEELWEVAYFDHIALTAVDHPADVEVFTNEKVGPPSLTEPMILTARNKLFPKAAIDSAGRDCLAKLAKVDRDFVRAFDELICQGLAEPHFVELDFGSLDLSKPWRLYLNGWMHPADTSLNIGMSQNPNRRGPEPPSLWVLDRERKWVCAQPFMGFPGGKPKSIVIDLKGVFQSDDHRLRIASSQQLYWDQAFVAHDSDASQCKVTPLPLRSAELHYRGFGRLKDRTNDQPHDYDYQSVTRAAKWSKLEGPFTRFGDVRELLEADDDRMVVMVSGDEFTATFPIPDHPLPTGWKRDFILHNVGWDKDADMNTLAGDGSLPLPFKSMHSYPPPPSQLEDSEAVLRLNADQLTRPRQSEFEF